MSTTPMFEDMRPSTPITTALSSDTIETRGQEALARLGAGGPLFDYEGDLADYLFSAKRKIDAHVLQGREIESFTFGEILALYFECFERQAHEDYMADRITHRQYATRINRLRRQIVKNA